MTYEPHNIIPAVVTSGQTFDPDKRHWKLALFGEDGDPFSGGVGSSSTRKVFGVDEGYDVGGPDPDNDVLGWRRATEDNTDCYAIITDDFVFVSLTLYAVVDEDPISFASASYSPMVILPKSLFNIGDNDLRPEWTGQVRGTVNLTEELGYTQLQGFLSTSFIKTYSEDSVAVMVETDRGSHIWEDSTNHTVIYTQYAVNAVAAFTQFWVEGQFILPRVAGDNFD